MSVFHLSMASVAFPDPAFADQDGLLAFGGDLSADRLLAAYQLGIFPWYNEANPILWWSPDPRCVLFPNELHVPRSLVKTMKNMPFTMTFDTAFEQVIRSCAGKRNVGNGTWLNEDMIHAYSHMHRLGFAHSVEAWQDGKLAGGLYGISLGRIFFGESMFFRVPDASKAALVTLVNVLRDASFLLIDCQQETDNLVRFGAKTITRSEFMLYLQQALLFPTYKGSWKDGLPA